MSLHKQEKIINSVNEIILDINKKKSKINSLKKLQQIDVVFQGGGDVVKEYGEKLANHQKELEDLRDTIKWLQKRRDKLTSDLGEISDSDDGINALFGDIKTAFGEFDTSDIESNGPEDSKQQDYNKELVKAVVGQICEKFKNVFGEDGSRGDAATKDEQSLKEVKKTSMSIRSTTANDVCIEIKPPLKTLFGGLSNMRSTVDVYKRWKKAVASSTTQSLKSKVEGLILKMDMYYINEALADQEDKLQPRATSVNDMIRQQQKKQQHRPHPPANRNRISTSERRRVQRGPLRPDAKYQIPQRR